MSRELSEAQQAIIAAALPEGGKVELLVDTAISAAEEYAGKFAGVFASKGWDVITNGMGHPGVSSPSGLLFLAPADLPMTDMQGVFLAALDEAEVPYNQLDAMMQEGVDLRLLMGRIGA